MKITKYLNKEKLESFKKDIEKRDFKICDECLTKEISKEYEYLFDTEPRGCDICGSKRDAIYIPLLFLHKKYENLNMMDWYGKLPRTREEILKDLKKDS